jgi:hypothetical protein
VPEARPLVGGFVLLRIAHLNSIAEDVGTAVNINLRSIRSLQQIHSRRGESV